MANFRIITTSGQQYRITNLDTDVDGLMRYLLPRTHITADDESGQEIAIIVNHVESVTELLPGGK